MQTSLLGEHKEPVECKESYGGFEVCYPEHIDYKDISPKIFRSGKMITKQFNSYEEAKESFEREVRKCYGRDVKWIKSKFQDSKGFFWLDGVKIEWELKTFYISTYHLEFNSEDKKPSLLTETGYLSDFPDLDCYDSVNDYIKDLVEYKINGERKKKKLKRMIEYRLEFEDTGYNPSKQFTLIELKGGKNYGTK